MERLLLGDTVAGGYVVQPGAEMGWGDLSSLSSPLLRGRPRELVGLSQGRGPALVALFRLPFVCLFFLPGRHG